MDWIDEQFAKLNKKLKMKSLKSVLRIYIVLAIFIVVLCYFLTFWLCSSWREIADNKLSLLLDYIQTFSILVYSIIAIITVSHLFFKNKIEEPMTILKNEASCIGRGDLSVSCRYESGDEFGDLCEAFDQMRGQMIKNYENLWSQMDSQRNVNAAFAHDIRNPLTVVQGYLDMMLRYYPEGKISDDKLLHTFTLMQAQLKRLNTFSDRMKELNDIEAMKVNPRKNNLFELVTKLQDNINGITFSKDRTIELKSGIHSNQETGYYDEDIILEVFDNIVSNAISFAKSYIEIVLEIEKDYLYLYVHDDGKGFSKTDIYHASNSYYCNREQAEDHFGMGLTICKILCEKHGGKLTLSNSMKQGAIVCASFRI
jgi:His Kinase A (phosphoacceptor) domain./Histidine kinase-, DNA gyrase B-, and HSP90-like ATPase.